MLFLLSLPPFYSFSCVFCKTEYYLMLCITLFKLVTSHITMSPSFTSTNATTLFNSFQRSILYLLFPIMTHRKLLHSFVLKSIVILLKTASITILSTLLEKWYYSFPSMQYNTTESLPPLPRGISNHHMLPLDAEMSDKNIMVVVLDSKWICKKSNSRTYCNHETDGPIQCNFILILNHISYSSYLMG